MDNISIKGEKIEVAYGSNVLMRDVDFEVNKGDVFIIMGGRPGQTGTLASDEKCQCGYVLPAGSYEKDYEQ